MDNWNSRTLKRELSKYEKEQIPQVFSTDSCLILPGSPGTEAEELVSRGFSNHKIWMVEREPEQFRILRDHYLRRGYSNMFEMELEDFISLCQSRFFYVHMDLCSKIDLSSKLLTTPWNHILADHIGYWVRITTTADPMFGNAAEKENELISATMAAMGYDWTPESEVNTAQLIALMILINGWFGVSVTDIAGLGENADLSRFIQRAPIPNPDSYQAWWYRESSLAMCTAWMYFTPNPKLLDLINYGAGRRDVLVDLLDKIVKQPSIFFPDSTKELTGAAN